MSGSITGLIRASTGKGKSNTVSHGANVDEEANFMAEMYSQGDENIEKRKKNAQKFVNSFYNIVTDFYEAAWGPCFHFAPRNINETFTESIIRLEHLFALKLNIKPTDNVLDVGCGIGGPMRNISLFTNANIIGVTINEYQVKRGNELNKLYNLDNKCKLILNDFCKLDKFADNTFDKIYAIEATCHSGNRNNVFKQIYRVLKPNGLFMSTEWCLISNKYNKKNKFHNKIKYNIEYGNALPDLITEKDCIKSFKEEGFNIIESYNLDEYSLSLGQIPWWKSLEFDYTMQTVQHSTPCTYFASWLTYLLESCKIAPKGTYNAHNILNIAREGLVEGGKLQLFTPYYIVVAQKPSIDDINLTENEKQL